MKKKQALLRDGKKKTMKNRMWKMFSANNSTVYCFPFYA